MCCVTALNMFQLHVRWVPLGIEPVSPPPHRRRRPNALEAARPKSSNICIHGETFPRNLWPYHSVYCGSGLRYTEFTKLKPCRSRPIPSIRLLVSWFYLLIKPGNIAGNNKLIAAWLIKIHLAYTPFKTGCILLARNPQNITDYAPPCWDVNKEMLMILVIFVRLIHSTLAECHRSVNITIVQSLAVPAKPGIAWFCDDRHSPW